MKKNRTSASAFLADALFFAYFKGIYGTTVFKSERDSLKKIRNNIAFLVVILLIGDKTSKSFKQFSTFWIFAHPHIGVEKNEMLN